MSRPISKKSLIRQILSLASYYGGYCLFVDLFKLNLGARILGYHAFKEIPANDYDVSISDFEWQMRFLAENYQVISMEDLVTRLKSGQSISPNTVVITIDDGFQDFYTNGYPVLQKYRLPATVFLPTGLIDGTLPPASNLPQGKFLSWDQIRELHSSGINFGSHTFSHATLVKQSAQEVQYEMAQSKARIEQELGSTVRGFAYPYGTLRHVHPRIEKSIIDAGYAWAVTTISGLNKPGVNLFQLRRTIISPVDGQGGFKRALRGALDSWVIFQTLGYFRERLQSKQ